MDKNNIDSENDKLKYFSVDLKKIQELEPRLNFLFVVHNDIEMDEMLHSMNTLDGYGKLLKYIDACGSKQSYFIGKFFEYDIVLMQTADMGYSEVDAVINTLNSAIAIFKPRFIVMPGIAAGMDKEINIGDVVIAKQIIGYEIKKIGKKENILRCPSYYSHRMFNLFNGIPTLDFNMKWECELTDENEIINKSPKIYKGIMLSGEKLLDNRNFKKQLLLEFKEAKALDMEGLGVASASIFNRVYDWIVIKGISDLGDGKKKTNKDKNQKFAMQNAIKVLKEVFNDTTSFGKDELKLDYAEYRMKKVMISSSQCEKGENLELTSSFLKRLSAKLIESDIKIISGYGLGVGPEIMTGIFEGLLKKNVEIKKYSQYFAIYPFPRIEKRLSSYCEERSKSQDFALESYKKVNRDMLCNNAKIFIFAFGQKLKDGVPTCAEGMFEELDYALKNKALIIPIGATGSTAKKIYEKTTENDDSIKKYYAEYFLNRKKEYGIEINIEDRLRQYLEDLKYINIKNLTFENIDNIVDVTIKLINTYG